MKTISTTQKRGIKANKSYEGEPLEEKIAKMLESKEPIGGDVPPIYTERKDGVKPQYDIRTDRWAIAQEASDKISKHIIAKRDEKQESLAQEADNTAD